MEDLLCIYKTTQTHTQEGNKSGKMYLKTSKTNLSTKKTSLLQVPGHIPFLALQFCRQHPVQGRSVLKLSSNSYNINIILFKIQ